MLIGSVGMAIGVAVVAFFIFALIVVFLKSCLKVVQQGCVGVVKRFGEFKTGWTRSTCGSSPGRGTNRR